MQEANAHLLLDISSFEDFAELFERNGLITVSVCLQDGSVGDRSQLVGRDVRTNHHVQDRQQLFSRDLGIVVQIIPGQPMSETSK